jgi:hypothetical protein
MRAHAAGELSRMILLESERPDQTSKEWTARARHRREFPGSPSVCRGLRRSECRQSQPQNERANTCNPCKFPVHRFAPFPRRQPMRDAGSLGQLRRL